MVKRVVYDLVTLLLAQFFFFVAISLSSFTVWDCHFVTIESSNAGDFLQSIEITTDNHHMTIPNINATTHGLGFFLWEGIDGKCALQENDNTDDDIWYHLYQQFLGPDWYIPRIMASISLAVSFLVLLVCTVIHTCLSNLKSLQYLVVFVLVLVLPTLQSIPFILFRSDFCYNNHCGMGRTAHYAIVAVLLYIATGLILLVNTHRQQVNGFIRVEEEEDDDDNDPEQQLYPIKSKGVRI
jgi:hypothetical protein